MNARFAIWTALPLLVFAGLLWLFLLKDPAPSTTAREIHIVAFGDSLTLGYGVPPEDAYPAVLERMLREKGYVVRVTNAGVSGETTGDGLVRVPSILDHEADLVLLGLGENDALRRLPPEETEKNLRAMLDLFRAAETPVVLLGMTSPLTGGLGAAQRFNAIYPRLAKEYDCPLVRFFLEGVALRPSLNLSDGIHPNAAGYRKVVEDNVLPVVVPYLRTLQ